MTADSSSPNRQTSEEGVTRRRLLAAASAAGVGSLVFQRALVASAQDAPEVTRDMILRAVWIAGLELTDEQRQLAADALNNAQSMLRRLRDVPVGYDVACPLVFRPLEPPQTESVADPRPDEFTWHGDPSADVPRPSINDELAYLPLRTLATLLQRRDVTSVELTQLYLDRLRQFDPLLKCVVTLTEELAMRQAEQADRELAAGECRGPLHGIPWGAKDLIAYPGYPTTWGAPQFRHQRLSTRATVARRLDQAGAVLVAKLTMGALALGDQWFGGRTRNPWNPMQGSSGSSAGSAAAAVAGLVGFSLGSETLGSIVSPSRRCGATGLRPTFGRVSRHGCMTLCWSLDKIGPIGRSVDDCALVFQAIHGHDPQDAASVSRRFAWPPTRSLSEMRVGYIPSDEEQPALRILQGLGCRLVPIRMPDDIPVDVLRLIVTVESGAVFDELTRRGEPKGVAHWPRSFAMAQFVSAVDYLRANRVRMLLMRRMDDLMRDVDVYVAGDDLTITNMTGHPQVTIPDGFHERDGIRTPKSLTFTGRLYDEETLLAAADAYQQATDYYLQRPPLRDFLDRLADFTDSNDILPTDRLDGS